MNVEDRYGTNRVIEPKQVLPTSAWRLDNSSEISDHEMRVDIKTIHVEGASFRQICLEAGDVDQAIGQKIVDIVIRRGKLHNPVTDTGGLLQGVIAAVGSKYKNKGGFQVGEEVLCNASLAALPLHIEKVRKIDRSYNQIEVDGYAIVYGDIPVIRQPQGLPVNLLLYTFNESGTLYRVGNETKGKRKFMVVGNNLMMNTIYGHVIRRVAGPGADIMCVLDKRSNILMRGGKIDQLVQNTFNEIRYVNILRPMEALINIGGEDDVDMSVNCAEIPGAETLNILATKSGGTVVFANLINNYNIALYITESIARDLQIRSADGYLSQYDEFDIEIVEELAPYFEGAEINVVQSKKGSNNALDKLGEYKVLAEDFVGVSAAMTTVLDEIRKVSRYDCNVLISGDTGVGKEKVANMIVKNSNRSMQPYVKVNCAAIAPNLMESEFFGYDEGSFTGAKEKGKKGFFELADNGTVFLDEVGELPLGIQAKLLRVIQDGEFYRVGGTRPVKTDVRILSATNRRLEDEVEANRFRRDLYYRLNVFPVSVPDLASRSEDVRPLVDHFLKKYGEKFDIEKTVSEDGLEYLEEQEWKGNIRELENVVQRLLIGTKGPVITMMDVAHEVGGVDLVGIVEDPLESMGEARNGGIKMKSLVEEYENRIIEFACEKYGSTRKAAKAIGISQTQLVRKRKKSATERRGSSNG